jgi:hypothetical protein
MKSRRTSIRGIELISLRFGVMARGRQIFRHGNFRHSGPTRS